MENVFVFGFSACFPRLFRFMSEHMLDLRVIQVPLFLAQFFNKYRLVINTFNILLHAFVLSFACLYCYFYVCYKRQLQLDNNLAAYMTSYLPITQDSAFPLSTWSHLFELAHLFR